MIPIQIEIENESSIIFISPSPGRWGIEESLYFEISVRISIWSAGGEELDSNSSSDSFSFHFWLSKRMIDSDYLTIFLPIYGSELL